MSLIDFKRIKSLFTGYTTGKAQSLAHQRKIIALVAVIAAPTAAIFSVINFMQDHIWLASVEVTAILLLIPCFRIEKNSESIGWVKNLLMFNAAMVASSLFIDGGIANMGMIWTLIFPFLAFLLMGLPTAWFWVLGFTSILTTAVALHLAGIYQLPYSDRALIYHPATFVFFAMIAAVFEMQFERLHIRHQDKIEELQELQTNLKHNIRHRTAALQKSNDKLKQEIEQHQETSEALRESEARFYQAQKMEAVGTLVGGIAHDFNNMLAGIIANLFMLKRKVKNDPELTSRIDSINQLVNGAADMIKQLLTFARKDNVEYKPFNLLPFINEACKLAGVSISPSTKLSYDFPSDPLWVHANATQLQQVIMNLINNARDAVKELDDATIRVTLEHYENDDTFRRKHPDLSAASFAKLTVTDNGRGIEKDNISKIFEPFFTTKGAGDGTGLGLAMCYGAIRGHGGMIDVESVPGEGTSFHVYLPIYDQLEGDSLEKTLQNAVRGHGESILIVEDDPILAKIQSETLTALGYHLMRANDGKEGVKLFKEHIDELDLLIMDVVMPVMGGIEASRKIRKLKPHIPIIFVTGYDPEGTIDGKNLPAPSDYILDKPFTIDELSQAVRKQLLESRAK